MIRFGGKLTMMYETVDPDENIKSDEKYAINFVNKHKKKK